MITVTAPRTAAGLVIGTARLAADLEAAAELLARQLRWVDAVTPISTNVQDDITHLGQPDPDVRLLLARRGGRAVGVARLRGLGPDGGSLRCRNAQLSHLYVVPEARGTGAGEALVAQAAVMAWWFGCRELRARTTVWPADAVRLLERVGLRSAGGDVWALAVEPAVTARQ
ncbi:MAG: GNAT family N-acetyltransferase [Acidimicrobiia bacterium]|nr:GNAT family N-acetyltransferase [Acidimicrobiia bacterium]